MYDLFFDTYHESTLWLSDGPNVGVYAASYQPGGGEGESVVDVVRLALAGTEADMEAKIANLEKCLRAAEYGHVEYLNYRVAAGGAVWKSQVLGGWLEPGEYDRRKAGGQALSVHIRRVNRWDSSSSETHPLSNGRGKSVDMGDMGVVSNHNDGQAGHDNWLGDDLTQPDLPATNERKPVVLTLQASDQTNSRPLTVFVGHRCTWGVLGVATAIECEGGNVRGTATGAMVINALNSDGAYYSVTWNGSNEQEIWQGDVVNALSLMGEPYRLLLRLQDVFGETVWFKWRVYAVDAAGEHLVSESESLLLEQGTECIEGPVMDLPPWQVTDTAQAQTLRLVLVVRAVTAGAHVLKLDFLQLLPMEGWRVYRPLDNQRTLKLVDDGLLGTLANDYGARSHSMEGPGVDFRWGTLGTSYTFVVVRHEADGTRRWPIDFLLKVKIESKQSRRML